jgi:hypothetical protein
MTRVNVDALCRSRSIEVWSRGEVSGWSRVLVGEGEAAELVIGAQVDVHEIYEAAAEPSA